MPRTVKRSAVLLALVSSFAILYSCSGPSAPEPGSPGFFWNAARGAWDAGDYAATADHLDDLLAKDEGEYSPRALPWALVVTSGMTDGYMEAADAYQKGVKANKAGAEPLRREMVRYHDSATRLILRFADKFESFNKLNLDSVPLAFSFPKGSSAAVPTLLTASTGNMPAASMVEGALTQTLQRNVILAASAAVGCPNDPAKAAQLFAAADAKVPRATFQLAMANSLFSMAEMFGKDKLDDTDKREKLCERAQKALKGVPESQDTKELTDKIAAAMKQMPKKS
jgi:hypothetical protein